MTWQYDRELLINSIYNWINTIRHFGCMLITYLSDHNYVGNN